jgi:hypothetical protein
VTNAETGTDLMADAQALASTLPTSGANGLLRSTIQAILLRVQNRTVTSRTDVEANLADLFLAVTASRGLSSNSQAMRLSLDELIRYWEARW